MGKTSVQDLTGQKFGKLTVIKRMKNNKHHASQWLCECDCGNKKEIIVTGNSLKSGRTKSCGCYAKERQKEIKVDITGQKFGRLTAIKRIGVENNRVYWLCRCDCDGNEKIYDLGNLKNGNTKSCGCLKIESSKANGKNNRKYNMYDLSGDYGIGYSAKGDKFYFDLEDYDKIKDYYWYKDKNGYIITKIKDNGVKRNIKMHRLIMNAKEGEEVDHIYHITYDNRKSELRIVDKSKNQMNKKLNSNNTSGCKGVCWHKLSGKWSAYITANKKRIHIGLFNDFEEAVKARKKAEEKYFGEYSYDINKIENKLKNGLEQGGN